jgi:hypothetical protein
MALYQSGVQLPSIPWQVTPKKPLQTFCHERASVVDASGSSVVYSFQ